MDCFATKINFKCPQYYTKEINAFNQSWKQGHLWIFSPLDLVERCVSKIKKDKAKATILTPNLPNEHWFNTLNKYKLREPILIHTEPGLFTPSPESKNYQEPTNILPSSKTILVWTVDASLPPKDTSLKTIQLREFS